MRQQVDQPVEDYGVAGGIHGIRIERLAVSIEHVSDPEAARPSQVLPSLKGDAQHPTGLLAHSEAKSVRKKLPHGDPFRHLTQLLPLAPQPSGDGLRALYRVLSQNARALQRQKTEAE